MLWHRAQLASKIVLPSCAETFETEKTIVKMSSSDNFLAIVLHGIIAAIDL
jgi:hypothetical protein